MTPYWLFEDLKKMGLSYKVFPPLEKKMLYMEGDQKKLKNPKIYIAGKTDEIEW